MTFRKNLADLPQRENIMPLDPYSSGRLKLKNRIVRAATYEGMADAKGFPGSDLADLYRNLAKGGTGMIITGFSFVSRDGRAMQPKQCGIDSDDKIEAWKPVVEAARTGGCKAVMQIAHTGRQTTGKATGSRVLAPSMVPCTYFRSLPRSLKEHEIRRIISEFAAAAKRCARAGFDGVEIHAAHGYLIHQFLSPFTNRRRDSWGGPLASRYRFLGETVRAVRQACPADFIILVKISPGDDRIGFSMLGEYSTVVEWLARDGADAVEISYGTMEVALNIIRGQIPVEIVLRENPLFRDFPDTIKKIWKKTLYPIMKREFIPFTENYNLPSAKALKPLSPLPVILVGGIRNLPAMKTIVSKGWADLTALCRPLVAEPDFPRLIAEKPDHVSRCNSCNLCTVYCDSARSLSCHRKK